MDINIKNISKDQARDTGLAMLLIILLIVYWTKYYEIIPLGIAILVVDMVCPVLFLPLAKVWFGLSYLIGTIMSKVILSIIFFIIVTPIGVVRRAFGADPMALKKWKGDKNTTVFKVRNKVFEARDLETPF